MVLDNGEAVDLLFAVAAPLVDHLHLRLQIIFFLVITME